METLYTVLAIDKQEKKFLEIEKRQEEREQKLREMKRADRLEEIIALDEPYTHFAKKVEKAVG